MLFDLRGRGRRRTVRVIYGGLALLIGAGLVFFGVGAGVGGGGLLNSLTGSEGAGSASFAAQIAKYKKLTGKQPNNVYGVGTADPRPVARSGRRSLLRQSAD